MKTNKLYLLVIILFSIISNAQIIKGNWMMGGAASFSHNKRTDYTGTSELTSLDVTPNVGYFFIDKLAVGASAIFRYVITDENNNFNYGIGPFVRYYFLEKEKPLNIFSEVSYGFEKVNNGNPKIENFNVKAGVVYFLNSSVGIEAALNYLNQKYSDAMYNGTNNSIYLGVGFQIHLEKD